MTLSTFLDKEREGFSKTFSCTIEDCCNGKNLADHFEVKVFTDWLKAHDERVIAAAVQHLKDRGEEAVEDCLWYIRQDDFDSLTLPTTQEEKI